jgi:hypothetical protein
MAQIIAAYVRVSSKGQDYPMQRHSVERAAEARGDRIGRWYLEKRSAKTIARPDWIGCVLMLVPVTSGACTATAWTAWRAAGSGTRWKSLRSCGAAAWR